VIVSAGSVAVSDYAITALHRSRVGGFGSRTAMPRVT